MSALIINQSSREVMLRRLESPRNISLLTSWVDLRRKMALGDKVDCLLVRSHYGVSTSWLRQRPLNVVYYCTSEPSFPELLCIQCPSLETSE